MSNCISNKQIIDDHIWIPTTGEDSFSTQTSTSNPWPITMQSTQSDIIIQLDSQETTGQLDQQKNKEMALSWSRILPEEIHSSSSTFVGSRSKITNILKIIREENSDLVIGFTWPPTVIITQYQVMYTVQWPSPQTLVYNETLNSVTEHCQVFTQVDVCKDDSGYGLAEHCTLPNSQEATPTRNNDVQELVIGCI